jgi:hypothetical protein
MTEIIGIMGERHEAEPYRMHITKMYIDVINFRNRLLPSLTPWFTYLIGVFCVGCAREWALHVGTFIFLA